jgi:NAD(P)-dependent dehydrogenase (short-subunit alcohol dehydrogenase family)
MLIVQVLSCRRRGLPDCEGTMNAMIWGANGGIGQALTRRLVQDGWRVAAVAREASRLHVPGAYALEGDVASEYDVRQATVAAAQELGTVDLWIYSIGDILSAPVSAMELDQWHRVVTANLTGAYLATHHSLPLLTDQAHLIYLGAVHERLRLPGLSAYAAAKAGLEAFATSLAKEERSRRVTVVRPGAVDTPLWMKVSMRLPKVASTPEAVADRIVTVYQEGQSGVIDL